jgi:hypothetical protein
VAVAFALLSCAALAASNGFPPKPPVTDPGHRRCGLRTMFGHRFPIEAQGITCGEARRLAAQRCRARFHRRWTCFSAREDGPFVIWFPTAELFRRSLYPVVLLRRYPCSQARVSPRLFGKLERGFPTRRQLLADDVLRCHLLASGDEASKAEGLLGPADSHEAEAGRTYLVYFLGPERDSLIQIDPELLVVSLRAGRVTGVEMIQGS